MIEPDRLSVCVLMLACWHHLCPRLAALKVTSHTWSMRLFLDFLHLRRSRADKVHASWPCRAQRKCPEQAAEAAALDRNSKSWA